MSHDLHFTIDNGDGTIEHGQDGTMVGQMDHLPDKAGTAPNTSAPTQPRIAALEYISGKLSQSAHPTVIIFHLLFKVAALFLYIFGLFFSGSGNNADTGAHFVSSTVVIILLLAADFWVVKNVTGRLLVGLRWWNKVENDDTTWIFESAEDKVVNSFDRSVFWTVLYATPVIWVGLLILAVLMFELNRLMIVGIALSLSMANVYGYYKCSSEQKARFQQMMQEGARQGAMTMLRSGMLNVLTGRGNGSTIPQSSTYV